MAERVRILPCSFFVAEDQLAAIRRAAATISRHGRENDATFHHRAKRGFRRGVSLEGQLAYDFGTDIDF
jgi:hypothetical protein